MKKAIIFLGLNIAISSALLAKEQTIVFGDGCFWGVEKYFDNLDGVKEATAGYAGGDFENPTYKKVLKHRYIGRFLYKFNSGVLNNPQGIVSSSSNPIISDSGNNFIRFFDRYGRENRKSKDVILNNPTKVSLTNGGIIVSDTNSNRLVFLTLLGNFVKELKLDKSPLSAIQVFDKNNNIYIAYSGKNGISKLSGKTDYPNENPKEIVQKFVEALNNGDSSTMRTLTVNKKIVDAIFTTKQYEKLLPYLKNHIKEYQIIFQDKSFATVLISFDNTEHTFKVGLLKHDNQWLIHKF